MKKTIFFSITIFALFFSINVSAQEISNIKFISNLQSGDSGPAVMALQKLLNSDPDTKIADFGVGSPGQETNYFGLLTKKAVIRFQEKYRGEVLTPAGLSSGTGFVGAMTIRKLNELVLAKTTLPVNQVNNTIIPNQSSSNNTVSNISNTTLKSLKPVILSVSPNKVRRGDTITIKGKNFTPINNIIILGDGPIKERFDGLASFDGETITFVYEPPVVKTMSKDEILALPGQYLSQIEEPLKKVGATIDDALTPFKGIKNETELRDLLAKNGHSFDEMYHYFHVLIFNSNGNNISTGPLLYGLRDFPFDNVAVKAKDSILSKLGKEIEVLVNSITSPAHAQGMNGGGFSSGIVMVCTCNGNTMTFQMDFSGGGSGLYVFMPGFMPNAGSGLVAGPWLGGYQTGGGTCQIGVTPYCVSITGNTPQKPVGYAM